MEKIDVSMNTWSANALGAQCIIFGNPDSFDNHSFVEYSSHHNTIFPWNHFHENFCELRFTKNNAIKCTYTGKKIYYRRIFFKYNCYRSVSFHNLAHGHFLQHYCHYLFSRENFWARSYLQYCWPFRILFAAKFDKFGNSKTPL